MTRADTSKYKIFLYERRKTTQIVGSKACDTI